MQFSEGNIAVRLNDLDATRATEQTAIVTSWAAGRGLEAHPAPPRPQAHWIMARSIQRFGLSSMLGYLQDCYCIGSIFHHDDILSQEQNLIEQLGTRFGRLKNEDQEEENQRQDDMRLEFIVSAVDGADGLRLGNGGAASLLAGGAPGTFLWPSSAREYFVLAINSELATKVGSAARDVQRNTAKIAITGPVYDLLSQVYVASGKAQHEFVNSSVMPRERHPFRPILGMLSRFSCLRTFAGSPVAAAIATYLGQYSIDAYTAVVSSTQAMMIAVAACATDGALFALPIAEREKDDERTAFYTSASKFLGAEDFVGGRPTPDVFLAATGIATEIVLDGVRFLDKYTVATQTICLRSHTRSKRFVTQEHDLRHKPFRLPSVRRGKPISFDKAFIEFKRLVE